MVVCLIGIKKARRQKQGIELLWGRGGSVMIVDELVGSVCALKCVFMSVCVSMQLCEATSRSEGERAGGLVVEDITR
jgi:hypothetical protein